MKCDGSNCKVFNTSTAYWPEGTVMYIDVV